MGLFKTKKARGGAFPSSADDRGVPGTSKAGGVRSLPSLPSSPFGKRGKKKKLRSKLPGRGAYEESLEESPEEDRERKAPEAQRPEARRDEDSGGGGGGGGDRACVPRSISAPSREAGSPLPPLPVTPGRDGAKGGAAEEEEDSIGSPCEAVRRSRRRTPATKGGDDGADDGAGDGDDAPRAPNPTAAHLRRCARALAPEASPDTGADAPSRALRHLFALSEDGGDKGARRIAMVRDGGGDGDGGDGANGGEGEGEEGGAERASSSLVPSLLSFLRRCPRDSSEQYLALLVLNNLSIPRTNKRPVAYTHGGARTLGRLLCEDPGCHLLAIVLVNLTFGDAELNRDLVEDGEAQLVEGLAYAFRLASLSARRLASLGPVPLTDADGAPREPRDLLASLDASLAEGPSPNDDDEEGDDADDEGGPFPETARWCLGAIKNLTRPGRLASLQGEEGGEEAEEDGALQATRATLDAGVLPAMLDVLERKDGAGGGRGAFVKGWQPNSAPDAALYALMHMASAPRVRERMRREGRTRAEGGTTEATIMGRCERTLAEILERGREMDGSLSPKASKRKGKGKGAAKGEEDDKEAGQARLQCLKARMALAHLLPEPPRVESSVAAALSPVRLASLLAAHEAHSLVELLSHVLAGRAKEGPGGYSSAAFSPKGVLHVLDRVLSEGGNRELFAATGCARRLNALLLGALAKYALGRKGEGEGGGGGGGAGPGATEALDAEAAAAAASALHRTSSCGWDEASIGVPAPSGVGAPFLPATFGRGWLRREFDVLGKAPREEVEARDLLRKVLAAYLSEEGEGAAAAAVGRGRFAAEQVLFRANVLRCEGSAEDMTYPHKPFPSVSDYDLDERLLEALRSAPVEESWKNGGEKPNEYIFGRSVVRYEKEGAGSKIFSNGTGTGEGPKVFPNALAAAEEIAARQPGPTDAVAVANNIVYYADGQDVYQGFVWKWGDGKGDTIERMYSAAPTLEGPEDGEEEEKTAGGGSTDRSGPYTPPRKVFPFLGRLKMPLGAADENEPISIFGLRCSAPLVCGKGNLRM